MNDSPNPPFEHLSPDAIVEMVESTFCLHLTGVLMPYSSYINRVYGIESEEGDRYVVKFYRPGRWGRDAILDEHRFVIECADADIAVVPPIASTGGVDGAGTTIQSAAIDDLIGID